MKSVLLLTLLMTQWLWALDPTLKSQSIRETIVKSRPWLHTDSEVRTGYFFTDEPLVTEEASTLALGAHVHLLSEEFYGLNVSAILYAMGSVSLNGADRAGFIVSDDQDAFAMLPEAYVNYRHEGNSITLGRQTFNTPYIDSDDWVMMPNYFTAVTYLNHYYDDLRYRAGYVYDSAGSGNAVAPQRFVRVSETFGATEDTAGVMYASAEYMRKRSHSLSLWGYRFFELADLLYGEAKAHYLYDDLEFTVGVQGVVARDSGKALLDDVDSEVLGTILRIKPEDESFSLHIAYERAFDKAFGYIGGGPYYTSMEILAIDDIEDEGSAINAALLYSRRYHSDLKTIVTASIGKFTAEGHSVFDKIEYDVATIAEVGKDIDVTLVYSMLENRDGKTDNGHFIRSVMNYRFSL